MILLLSGPIAVGKSTLANEMIAKYGFKRISTSNYLKRLLADMDITESREALQHLGDLLDSETDFTWLVEEVAKPQIDLCSEHKYWLIDAVRKPGQAANIKKSFRNVFHVHMTVDEQTLKLRFLSRVQAGKVAEAKAVYEQAIEHPNELASRSLGQFADLIIDMGQLTASEAGGVVWGGICKEA